ncbi:uncharacterized protein [Nicotiana sylvestris]|uniref:uncharacterized protein n=1 Tax=Nicotiana sylvestris TaxID=4096 RepID=UPI00388CA1C1
MDRFRLNTENAPDVFYIQNLKKKPTETFREYATRWRSEASKVRPSLDEEQMNKFFVRAQDPQYYKRFMVIKNHKFSDIIKLGERIKEGIKSGMLTNFEALQATNKALQSGGISKKRDVRATPPTRQNYPRPQPNFDCKPPRQYTAIYEPIDQLYERLKSTGYVTHVPAVELENPSQWVNPNKTCAYHSGMKGHTTDECRTLKDKIETLIDNKVIQAKEATPNVCNNPLPDHKGGGEHTQSPIEVEIAASVPFEVEVAPPVATPAPFEVEVVTPFTVTISTTPPFDSKAIPWDYVAEARRKGKANMEEPDDAQGMTRTGRIYTPAHLGGPNEYKNALMKVLSEAYVPNNTTCGEMANMVEKVLESHKIIFHVDELPPEGLNHNKALHITVQFEDKFIVRALIDRGSSLNICPLDTLKRLGKGFHEIRAGSMNIKAFDGSQRATIREIIFVYTWGQLGSTLNFRSKSKVSMASKDWGTGVVDPSRKFVESETELKRSKG